MKSCQVSRILLWRLLRKGDGSVVVLEGVKDGSDFDVLVSLSVSFASLSESEDKSSELSLSWCFLLLVVESGLR